MTIGAPSKKELKEQKRAWLLGLAAGLVAKMKEIGAIVQDNGTPMFIPNPDQTFNRFYIERGNGDFEAFVHRYTGFTPTEYNGKIVIDDARLLARSAAVSCQVVSFSQYQQSRKMGRASF